MKPEERKNVIKQQLDVLATCFFDEQKDKDGNVVPLEKDPERLTMAMIGLSSLQLYCEQYYVRLKRSQPDIEIVPADQMPKA